MSSKAMTTSTSTLSTSNATASNLVDGYRMPDAKTLAHCCKLSISEDKPILLDYWIGSLDKTVLIGLKAASEEKLLVKSEEEYTSPISKIFKVNNEYIICTENSIYIVDIGIPSKRISN
jgi:hypothetical protein